ncbi:MAG: HTTM domain-containing protein [Polyangiaceae bacterium]|nr:HTTM domain-containing protein [Polyangiaceae bacterium]
MTTTATDRAARGLSRAVDPASLVAFRVALGGLVAVASIRFVAKGWVAEHFVDPRHYFPYWGFEWVRPVSASGMYAVYALMTLAALGVAAGALYRVSAATLFALFTYTHLCDKTHYLNHYYLVSLLTGLAALLPLHHHGSVDAWWSKRRGRAPRAWPAAWVLWLVRYQVGLVYFFGGVAKLGPDWLVHAMPLRIWLARGTDVFLIGPIFRYEATAYLMSWGGAVFDLSIPFLLLYRKTRPFAFAAVLAFHVIVGRLFQLGMFPWFMPAFATILFEPDWPRRLWRGWCAPSSPPSAPAWTSKIGMRVAAVYCVVQALLPLRFLVYPGNVLWTEEGFRFAWKVMLQEKNGVVTARAVDRSTGERFYVAPSDYLTPLQERMMSTQPDMILQFAHMIRDDFRTRGRDVSVYVDARVSLNGRPSRPLVDSTVDLSNEREGLAPKRWVLPMPKDPPRF